MTLTRSDTEATWYKSSYSGGNCLEVATGNTTVPIRDSKNPVGPTLRFRADAWSVFLGGIRRGGASDLGGR
ncbi:DUF397 domain-containing protein [Streptomyces coelicoflavus]|uniref:DUF397 domain-containing protein n=1 Tax=Streptomyces coelicoflavus TaxID=285562 RepID=UPI00210DB84D|nr:DUF397 domain-containing protein [Streptomyces coelicoflavus]MCQ4204150.1 DUF397 domain-containing protein [Streptomyces coelicoflavus]